MNYNFLTQVQMLINLILSSQIFQMKNKKTKLFLYKQILFHFYPKNSMIILFRISILTMKENNLYNNLLFQKKL